MDNGKNFEILKGVTAPWTPPLKTLLKLLSGLNILSETENRYLLLLLKKINKSTSL